MKVDWKYFAQTSGYKSLKASVNKDKMRWPRDKERYEKMFRNIINMVCKYAQATDTKPWVILDTLEEKRDYWYPNYYQNQRFVELLGINLMKKRLYPSTLRGTIRSFKHGTGHFTAHWYSPKEARLKVQQIIRNYRD